MRKRSTFIDVDGILIFFYRIMKNIMLSTCTSTSINMLVISTSILISTLISFIMYYLTYIICIFYECVFIIVLHTILNFEMHPYARIDNHYYLLFIVYWALYFERRTAWTHNSVMKKNLECTVVQYVWQVICINRNYHYYDHI
jgi:hypothetical protein